MIITVVDPKDLYMHDYVSIYQRESFRSWIYVCNGQNPKNDLSTRVNGVMDLTENGMSAESETPKKFLQRSISPTFVASKIRITGDLRDPFRVGVVVNADSVRKLFSRRGFPIMTSREESNRAPST